LINGIAKVGRSDPLLSSSATALFLFPNDPGVAFTAEAPILPLLGVAPRSALPPLPDPGVVPTTSPTLLALGVLGSSLKLASKNAYSLL
jgi:hypothetical protein